MALLVLTSDLPGPLVVRRPVPTKLRVCLLDLPSNFTTSRSIEAGVLKFNAKTFQTSREFSHKDRISVLGVLTVFRTELVRCVPTIANLAEGEDRHVHMDLGIRNSSLQ